MATIGFIGLGHMGGPMAVNLVKAGHELIVFDIIPSAVSSVVQQGAVAASSVIEITQGTDFIISMLPSSPHVEALYLNDTQLIKHIETQSIVIECSTIAPESARRVARACTERGINMLDAPVSGGTKGAIDGTLTFIVGGEQAILDSAHSILSAMGKNIFHAGDSGAGQVAKICNNMLLAIHMLGTAEALQLGVANGLDPKVLSDIMQKSSGRNWSLDTYNPYPGVMEGVPADNDYLGGFMVDLMAKDLGLAMEAALQTKSTAPMGALARSLYALHSSQGKGDLDFSSIQQMYAKKVM